MDALRIGCVPYLNARPLVEGLTGLVQRPPAELGELLLASKLDVALLPVIEVLRQGWATVPGLAIASPGEVDSVRLHLRKPLAQVRTVALDRNSRTSNALTRILLEKRHGLKPNYIVGDPEEGLSGDAAVTIGDASFRDYGIPSLDLGSEWRAFTGKPFVFALWAHRPDHPRAADIRRTLQDAFARADIEAIVAREYRRVGIPHDRCRRYLTRCISFKFGTAEKAGLKLFRRHAESLGLLPPVARRQEVTA
jgi:predicted solute-binding protein